MDTMNMVLLLVAIENHSVMEEEDVRRWKDGKVEFGTKAVYQQLE